MLRYIGNGILIAVLLLAGTACENELELPQRREAFLGFTSVSDLHKRYLSVGDTPLLINGNDTLSFERTGIVSPSFVSFPNTINTWAGYLPVEAGRHTVEFLSSEGTPRSLIEAEAELPENGYGRLFLSDSLGHYRTSYIYEPERAAAREIRLRVLHFSPDAGLLDVLLNGQPLGDPVGYLGTTERHSLQVSPNKTDTTLTLQFRENESGTVLLRRSLTLKPGETCYLMLFGYLQDASFPHPGSGAQVTIQAGLRTGFFKFN